MAKRKAKKPESGWRLSTIFWMIVTALSGGGISGYLNPELPIVGPFVQNLYANKTGNGSATPTEIVEQQDASITIGRMLTSVQVPPSSAATPAQIASAQIAAAQKPNDRLLIATFNIQVFGSSKLAKEDAMAVIVNVIRQFDIVAIQEVRAKEDNILPTLIDRINADGSRYNFLIGPRLGRTVSTEQYAFVYDTNRVEFDPSSVRTIDDPHDLLHREPFIARFRPRTNTPDRAFTFWLVNTHTDPDEVAAEVAALADVFQAMRSDKSGEDDVILLGDLNASETQLGRLGKIPGIRWVVQGGVMTNTRQNKAYDNIIFDGPSTNEYTGRWGVFNLKEAFQLTADQALQISDHFPVWAEFGIWEAAPGSQIASRGSEPAR